MHFLLLVDDNRPACDTLGRLLGRRGYATACVYSAVEALAVLRDLMPDLVVLDWMMPGADGLEVAGTPGVTLINLEGIAAAGLDEPSAADRAAAEAIVSAEVESFLDGEI